MGGCVKIPRVGTLILIFVISLAPIFLSGCSVMSPVGDFFGQQYVNTVSYFNTFYNAKKLYDEAVEETEQAERRHREQRQARQFEVPQQTKEKFNEIIEKCSRLLHQYPTSRYADDAVLMIGQSYYMMRQNVQAERKFLELIAEFPDSRLVPEGQLLLAKTQRRMNKHSEAQIALENLVERVESRRDRDIAARAHIELGDIQKKEGNLNNAVEHFQQAVDIARNSEIRTEARFHLANIYYELELYEDAFEKYTDVIDDSPISQILYESHIAKARILTQFEEYDQAIGMLADLLNDRALVDYQAGIELEAAHVFHTQELIQDAIDQYVYVDTTHTRTNESLKAQYSLGSIYLNTFSDYRKAIQYFERVAQSTPPSDVTRDAWAKYDYLERYVGYTDDIIRLDSVIATNEKELMEIEREIALASEAPDTADTAGTAGSDTLDMAGGLEQDGIQTPEQLQQQIAADRKQLIQNYYELAGLFNMEMERPDSAIYYYSRLVFEYPESQYAPQALYALAELMRSAADRKYDIANSNYLFDSEFAALEPQTQRDSIYSIIIDRYPNTEFSNEAKRLLGIEVPRDEQDAFEDIYLQAEEMMFDENYEDALYMFQFIADDTTGSKYAVKACYAIGWIYENVLLKPDSAAVYYQRLVDKHPETEYASAVQEKVQAWNEMITEEERKREEEEAARLAEEAEQQQEDEEIDEESPRQRGIPLARPTDRENLEEEPDTTQTEEQNED